MSFNRLAGIAGLVFVAIALAILVISGSQPAPGAEVDDIIEYLSQGEPLRDVNALLSAVGLLPLVVFFAGLLMPFRVSDRRHDEGWSTSILLGVVALTASIAVHESAFYALSYRGAAPGLDGELLKAVDDERTNRAK